MLGTVLGLLVIGLVGGFFGRILFGSGDSLVQPSSWTGSIVGSVLVLTVYLMIMDRAGTDSRAAE